LGSMTNLERLDVDYNQITSTDGLGSLINLDVLFIDNNDNLIPCSQLEAIDWISSYFHDSYYDKDRDGHPHFPPFGDDEKCFVD